MKNRQYLIDKVLYSIAVVFTIFSLCLIGYVGYHYFVNAVVPADNQLEVFPSAIYVSLGLGIAAIISMRTMRAISRQASFYEIPATQKVFRLAIYTVAVISFLYIFYLAPGNYLPW